MTNVEHIRELDETDELEETPELEDDAPPPAVRISAVAGAATGDDLLRIARMHIGERYVLGARAPMANAGWSGPWDCAEFVSWCVFQASGILYGTRPRNDPMLADAFTGFWADQAQAGRHTIEVQEAAAIRGAAVLRKPASGLIGHIVLSDGKGGTVEAHSSMRGVIAGSLSARRWDCGILVPGIRYFRSEQTPQLDAPQGGILRLTMPLMRGPRIRALQARLRQLGFAAGAADGVYGPQTAHAVKLFQASKGLVADGEAGPATRAALGLA